MRPIAGQVRHHPARRLRGGAALLTVALLASGVVTAGPASADAFDDGQWYYTNFNLAADHAKANGTGIKVAVIDGPLDTAVPELAGANIVNQPTTKCIGPDGAPLPSTGTGLGAGHATPIAVMLVGNGTGNAAGRGGSGVAPGITLLHYLNGVSTNDPAHPSEVTCPEAPGGDNISDEATGLAIDDAVAAGARVVSLSVGSLYSSNSTMSSVGRAERAGVVVLAATDDHADTQGDRMDTESSFNGVVAVNGLTAASTLGVNSAISPLVTVAAPGSNVGIGAFYSDGVWNSAGTAEGSSFATPFTAGVIADAMSAFPHATSNQILQLMLRTTGGTLHDLQRSSDGFGFGVPSLTTMLENDPARFPDENPLLRDGADPPTSDILGSSTASPSPTSTGTGAASPTAPSTPAAAATQDSGSSAPWLWIGVVVVVVLLAAVAVFLVVARRRGRTGPPAAPPPYVRT